jgi:phosphoribosylformylglycinamidine (FGAM) synthase-like enzyme
MLNLPFGQIGKVTDTNSLVIKAADGKKVIDLDINKMKNAWQKTLNW